MSSKFKKIASIIITISMIFALTGCFNKPYKKVYYAAEDFATAIIEMNSDKIEDLSSDDLSSRDLERIQLSCNYSDSLNTDNSEVKDEIKSTFSYEIDAGSLTTSGNKGSVKVIFTFADWESALTGDNTDSLSSAKKAIKNADSVTVTVTVKFEKKGEKWLVTNTSDITSELYGFSDETFLMSFDSSCLTGAKWWFTDEGIVDVFEDPTYVPTYTNETQLDLDVYLDDYMMYSEIYYTVLKDGVLVYTSNTGCIYGYFDEAHNAEVNDYGCILSGTYTISFYNNQGCIFSSTCNVICDQE